MKKRIAGVASLVAIAALAFGCGLGPEGHPVSGLLEEIEVHEADGGNTVLVVYLADRSTPEEEVKAEAEEMAGGFMQGRKVALVVLLYNEDLARRALPDEFLTFTGERLKAAMVQKTIGAMFGGGGFLVQEGSAEPQWVLWSQPPAEGESIVFPDFGP